MFTFPGWVFCMQLVWGKALILVLEKKLESTGVCFYFAFYLMADSYFVVNHYSLSKVIGLSFTVKGKWFLFFNCFIVCPVQINTETRHIRIATITVKSFIYRET